MSSGKRQSVVICCNSKNTALYLDPIDYYRPDLVHIFVNDNKDDIDYEKESKTFEKAYGCINSKELSVEECDIHDFESLVSKISEIIEALKSEYLEFLDIFINITSGTHEFAAAGILSAMSNSDVATAFRLNILKNDGGKCITSEPIRVTSLNTSIPDREMIAFLEILNDKLSLSKTVSFKEIIGELKNCDQWSYDPKRKSNYGRDTIEHKEITYLTRHYVKYAVECGWITRPSKYRFQITAAGKSVLNVHSVRTDYVCMNPCDTYNMKLTGAELSGPTLNDNIEQENEVFDILDEDMQRTVPYRINGKNCIIRFE